MCGPGFDHAACIVQEAAVRIGIDARVMSLKASGIGRYTIEMVKSMAAQVSVCPVPDR